jgi:hypothetical protein
VGIYWRFWVVYLPLAIIVSYSLVVYALVFRHTRRVLSATGGLDAEALRMQLKVAALFWYVGDKGCLCASHGCACRVWGSYKKGCGDGA